MLKNSDLAAAFGLFKIEKSPLFPRMNKKGAHKERL
jgi:hypothetical protein